MFNILRFLVFSLVVLGVGIANASDSNPPMARSIFQTVNITIQLHTSDYETWEPCKRIDSWDETKEQEEWTGYEL